MRDVWIVGSGRGGTRSFSFATPSEAMDDDPAGEARINNSSSRSAASDRSNDKDGDAGGVKRSTRAKPSLR